MRPPDQNVTFVLNQMRVNATNDSGGDEPYLWLLGFKVDADTLGPPPSGSAIPNLGVKVFEGAPASPYLVGPNDVDAPATLTIQPNLGTRSFGLRPALLPVAGWFPGIAGVIGLLWDQDAFSPSTAEAGYNAFKKAFGPALTTELNSMVNGGYDDPLSRDAAGNVVPMPPGAPNLDWRLNRLANTAARKNLVKAMTDTIKNGLHDTIKDAFTDAANWDELIDPDDLLGAQVQVYLGSELRTQQSFTLDFTDNDANYTAYGHAWGFQLHSARLDSTVVSVTRTLDRMHPVWMRVCWFPIKEYHAYAFRLTTTTRYQLTTLFGPSPAVVRWFVDGTPLGQGAGTLAVTFEAMDKYSSPPQDALAPYYPGGPGVLAYSVSGSTLDITNTSGDGVFFGTVHALYAYDGDPSLFPSVPMTPTELLELGYDDSEDLSVHCVELVMDSQYREDVAQCKKIVDEIDRKHIAVDFGRARINPGDPPPDRDSVLAQVTADARVANAAAIELAATAMALQERQ